MILSVDFNPLLKRKIKVENIKKDTVNIADYVVYGPGGHGLELTYFLNSINEQSLATGFLGGVNGSIINNYLESDKIPNVFFSIKDETSESINISTSLDENIIINSKEPRITREEYEGFFALYNRLILDSKIICLLGELPPNLPKDIFFNLIINGNKLDNKTLIAVKGEGLKYAIESKPEIALLEISQLEDLTNLKLDYEYEIIKAGYYIIEKGVNILVVSLGNRGSIVLTKDFIYRVDVSNGQSPEQKPHFEYMLGGFALSIKRGYDLETFLKVGQACGIAKGYSETEEIDMGDIKKIMGDIEVTRYNY